MKLKTGQKAAFGFGAFGKDVVYMLISSYLLYYYNVVLGISSVFIGTVMMAARVFDAFNDPIMGIIVAKTKTRWGRFRPWILAGTVLNAVTIYALYATPESMGDSAQRIWLIVFYFAWGITYTLMDIPFWSMIPAITEPGEDREALTSLARTCSGIGDAIPTVLTMTIVPILSASSAIADYRIGFRWWALIVAVVFVISELICVLKVPEKPIETTAPTSSVGQMFRTLFANDQAMTVVVSIILVYTSVNICGNLVLYFFQFDVGNEGAYSIFAAVAFAAQVLVMMIVPALRKKFTKAQAVRVWIPDSDCWFSCDPCDGIRRRIHTGELVHLMYPGNYDLSGIRNVKCDYDDLLIGFGGLRRSEESHERGICYLFDADLYG